MQGYIPGSRIRKGTNVLFNLLFLILALSCVIPFLFVIVISFSSESSLSKYGYTLWPKEWTLVAYQYLFSQSSQLLDAYGVTIVTTVCGTAIGVLLTAAMGYALSRPSYKLRNFFTYFLLITMLFNGGMIAFYLVVVRVLNLSDNLLSLILPTAVSAFNVIIMRTFIQQGVPDSCIESASIDGASQYVIFFRIVLPMSLPALATVGLFLTITYWNSWFNAMLFISTPKLMPLQEFMMNVLENIQFMQANSTHMGASSMTAISQLPQESAQMAIVVLATVPIVFTYPFFQRYFISGLTIGAVKG